MEDSFVDLRLNRQEGQVNESFWPSFTDIMTVIVMIFLIAMVVLLMRNMELVTQLRATMEAERTASELAEATGQEANLLADSLHREEEMVAQLRMQIMRLQEENDRREKLINQRNMRIQYLNTERDNLTQQAAQLTLALQQSDKQRDSAQSALNQQERMVADLNTQLSSLRDSEAMQKQQLQSLLARTRDQQELVDQSQEQQQEIEQKYLVLADEFDDLKVRYDKLVRPARTSKGRYLVEVRYRKVGGKSRIEWRHNNATDYAAVTRKQLDQKLTALKKAKRNGLYVKIIIPENSGLSYNEAWEFTNHIHKGYDYYFQDE